MWPDIEALGFDLRFKRMWEYYLSYCEVGFAAGAVDVNLLELAPSG
jgi:cyclopropane-fatty-acyl-phospholipid synthase